MPTLCHSSSMSDR